MATDKETRDILAYLNDTLPGRRRAAFEARLQTDPALQQRVDSFRKVDASLAQLSALHQLRQAKQQSPARVQPLLTRQLVYRYAASVALILLASLGAYRYYWPLSRQVYDDFYSPDTDARGGVTACPEALQPVVQLYESKQYEPALAALERGADQSSACVQYQKGLIQLALDEPEKAIVSFNQSIQADLPEIRQQSEWYLSLAYLRTDQVDLARPLLQKIADEPVHLRRQSAQRALKRLDA